MDQFLRKCQKQKFDTLIPPLFPGLILFENSGCVTFFILLTSNFMQSFRKTNTESLEIFKEGQTNRLTNRQGQLLWTPTGKPGVQNIKIAS